MTKTFLSVLLIVAVVCLGGGFFGGMKYGQSACRISPLRSFNAQELGANAGGFRGGRMGGQGGGGFVAGEIISKDDESITIQLRDGGSKIIFYSETTEIGKFVSGTPNDLEVGETVTINGEPNQDGSVTAKSIQLRPEIISP